jgi:muramoyltetrapeptide carboxypeptidase
MAESTLMKEFGDAGYLRPRALRPGDKVGVIAPSFPSAAWFPRRLEVAVDGLRDSLGVEPIVAPHVFDAHGYVSGSPNARAAELQGFLEDPSIRAIFTTLGGFNSNELLSHLDFSRIDDAPKIVIGYSDVTALLLALTSTKKWVTFYGPALLPQMGEYPGPQPFTLAQLRRMLTTDCTGTMLSDPTERTDHFLDWAKDESYETARTMKPNPGREVWRSGVAEGILFGGNLETLNFMVGTPWFEMPRDTILYIEATEAEAYLPRLQRALTHLRQCHALDHVRGLLVGQSPDAKPVAGDTLRAMVLRTVSDLHFPIVGELSFGHVDPILTLPNGCMTRIEARSDGVDVQLLDTAVSLGR